MLYTSPVSIFARHTMIAILVLIFSCSIPTAAQNTSLISYDAIYDNATEPLSIVSCASQLQSLGFTTLDSLPDFPYVGGASSVVANGSAGCGTCWELSFGGNVISVLAIDYTDDGFNVAEEAFNALTNGQARSLGRINATVAQVNASACGL